jgi:molybdopterin/thiamine biosynthesis adenylyltransferase
MDFHRQLDILSPQDLENIYVTIIGVGGIGSPSALVMSKMGVEKITVYDNDVVETHNLPNQMYRINDIGKTKVEGTKDICYDFSGIYITTKLEQFTTQPISGVVVSGVDSMVSRSTIWNRIKFNVQVPLYIDARMGAEVCRICTVNPCDPDDVKWYEKTLFSDDKASEEKCTEKAIIYNTFVISGLIASQVKKYARAQPFAREIIMDLKTLIFMAS